MQLFWDIFLLKNVNKLRYFNILFLSMLETILYDFTPTSFDITKLQISFDICNFFMLKNVNKIYISRK